MPDLNMEIQLVNNLELRSLGIKCMDTSKASQRVRRRWGESMAWQGRNKVRHKRKLWGIMDAERIGRIGFGKRNRLKLLKGVSNWCMGSRRRWVWVYPTLLSSNSESEQPIRLKKNPFKTFKTSSLVFFGRIRISSLPAPFSSTHH